MYTFLTIAATDPHLIAELGLGVEGAITADGEVLLPEPVVPYLFSFHLPFARAGTHLNVGALDDAVRREAIGLVQRAIDVAVQRGARRGVIHPMGLGRWGGKVAATWERTVAGLREVVDHASAAGLELCLENTHLYWDGVPQDAAPEAADRSGVNHIIGSTPAEWLGLWRAIGRDALGLCLDTSHAATYAALSSDPGEAERLLHEYLAEPALIRHVHWSDSWLCDPRGTLPAAFHARVKALAATKHLEHVATPDQLRAELAHIAAL
jgi:sugar phosphate isomerase/epimerase